MELPDADAHRIRGEIGDLVEDVLDGWRCSCGADCYVVVTDDTASTSYPTVPACTRCGANRPTKPGSSGVMSIPHGKRHRVAWRLP